MSLFSASKNNWKLFKKGKLVSSSNIFIPHLHLSLKKSMLLYVRFMMLRSNPIYESTYYNSILLWKDSSRRILLGKYNDGKKLFQLFRKNFWKTILDYLKISFVLEFRNIQQYLIESTMLEEWIYWYILKVIHVFLILLYDLFYKGLNTFEHKYH